MGNKLVLVVDLDVDYQWVYVNGELKHTGEPIGEDQWLSIIKYFGYIPIVEKYCLTESFGEKVNYDYNQIPQNFNEFVCEDLEFQY